MGAKVAQTCAGGYWIIMKLTTLELRNLSTVEAADFDFAPGINILIGENGTGKSHLLKALYALLRATRARRVPTSAVEQELGKRLAGIFRPDDGNIGRLVRAGASRCDLRLQGDRGETHCSVDDSASVAVMRHDWDEDADALFLPSREVLAMFEGFAAAYQDRELSFDETYFDVSIALARAGLRGKPREAANALGARIWEMLGGKVELRGNRFYVDLGDGFREAHLIAEGFRKIATLAHLVQNGSIKPGGVLLWDEPEAGLNPRLVSGIADILCHLAANGVQIFLATHDYLLSQRLSLAVEYQTVPRVEMRFFSLCHERPTDPVQVEHAPTLAEIEHNPILAAYAEYYDHERDMFGQDGDREEDVP